jgi:hypothetical protein
LKRGLAADKHFVAFDYAGQWRGSLAIRSHCKPDTVHQEESRFITDLAMPLDFESRDTFLRCGRSPERVAPMPKLNPRFFVDRADTDTVLLFAVAAAP